MDPDVTLKEMLELAEEIIEGECRSNEWPFDLEDKAIELAEKVQNLDKWMTRRGYPPKRWSMEHQSE